MFDLFFEIAHVVLDTAESVAKIIESESLKTKAYSNKERNRFETINSMLVKQEMREDRELLEDLDVYINTLHLFEENLSVL